MCCGINGLTFRQPGYPCKFASISGKDFHHHTRSWKKEKAPKKGAFAKESRAARGS
jgi:hypothetical protein